MASGTRRRRETALAAGATGLNLVADDTLRYPGVDSILEVAATCEAAAANVFNLQVEIGNTIVYTGLVPVEALAGRGPILPDDLQFRTGVAEGDQIAIRFRNDDAAAARSGNVLFSVEPAA